LYDTRRKRTSYMCRTEYCSPPLGRWLLSSPSKSLLHPNVATATVPSHIWVYNWKESAYFTRA
ncbi:hypothetical protein COCCADRAFT_109791, partial [Bipolaris zeicola 26-R-13]